MALRSLLTACFIAWIAYGLHAQEGYLRLGSFQRIAYRNKASFAWSGAAVSGGYTYRVSRKDRLDFGAEAGFLEWGAQTLTEVGYYRRFSVAQKLYLTAGGHIYNGMVLFRPKPLYAFAAQARGGIMGRVHRRLDLGFVAGVRYSLTPQYRHYSDVYSYWHFTGELVFVFRKPVRHVHHINPSF